jgi:uncharacterized protein YqiB (DUF1249 family)
MIVFIESITAKKDDKKKVLWQSDPSIIDLYRASMIKEILKSRQIQEGKTRRRFYKITSNGKKELNAAKIQLRELIGEILE